jgi:hypothetical protein
MAKEPELMINVGEGEFPSGTRLLDNDPAVLAHPRHWVLFSAGDRAIFSRRSELKLERGAMQEKHRAALRESVIAQGTRILGSDSATAESAKRLVLESAGALVLVHDDQTGTVIGARPRP